MSDHGMQLLTATTDYGTEPRSRQTLTLRLHDALGHALRFHPRDLESVELGLRLATVGDRQLREEHDRAITDPTIERVWQEHIPLSLEGGSICEIVSCPPHAHRAAVPHQEAAVDPSADVSTG